MERFDSSRVSQIKTEENEMDTMGNDEINDNVHKCPDCKKTFTYPRRLQEHRINFCTKLKQYKQNIDIQKNTKMALLRTTVNLGMDINLKSLVNKCEYCGLEFAYSSSYITHLRTHENLEKSKDTITVTSSVKMIVKNDMEQKNPRKRFIVEDDQMRNGEEPAPKKRGRPPKSSRPSKKKKRVDKPVQSSPIQINSKSLQKRGQPQTFTSPSKENREVDRPVQSSPTQIATKSPRKRGRPRKSSSPSKKKKRVDNPVSNSPTRIDSESPKKRGRPRKSTSPSKKQKGEDNPISNSPTQIDSESPKKRGRPRNSTSPRNASYPIRSRPSRKRSKPKKFLTPNKEGTPVAQKIPRKVGRPRKSSIPRKENEVVQTDSKTPRKRGRPRKSSIPRKENDLVQTDSTNLQKTGQPSESLSLSDKKQSKKNDSIVPKKRGRPRKSLPSSAQVLEQNPTVGDVSTSSEVRPAKKRGRPPKSSTQEKIGIEQTSQACPTKSVTELPKKRGRPRKSHSTNDQVTKQNPEGAKDLGVPRKRGRPRKSNFTGECVRPQKSKEQPVKCTICDIWFLRKCNFANHMRSHRTMTERNATNPESNIAAAGGRGEKKEFQCSVCDKVFFSKYILKRHMSSHWKTWNNTTSTHKKPWSCTKKSSHKCRVCYKEFISRYFLKKHTDDSHAGEKKIPAARRNPAIRPACEQVEIAQETAFVEVVKIENDMEQNCVENPLVNGTQEDDDDNLLQGNSFILGYMDEAQQLEGKQNVFVNEQAPDGSKLENTSHEENFNNCNLMEECQEECITDEVVEWDYALVNECDDHHNRSELTGSATAFLMEALDNDEFNMVGYQAESEAPVTEENEEKHENLRELGFDSDVVCNLEIAMEKYHKIGQGEREKKYSEGERTSSFIKTETEENDRNVDENPDSFPGETTAESEQRQSTNGIQNECLQKFTTRLQNSLAPERTLAPLGGNTYTENNENLPNEESSDPDVKLILEQYDEEYESKFQATSVGEQFMTNVAQSEKEQNKSDLQRHLAALSNESVAMPKANGYGKVEENPDEPQDESQTSSVVLDETLLLENAVLKASTLQKRNIEAQDIAVNDVESTWKCGDDCSNDVNLENQPVQPFLVANGGV